MVLFTVNCVSAEMTDTDVIVAMSQRCLAQIEKLVSDELEKEYGWAMPFDSDTTLAFRLSLGMALNKTAALGKNHEKLAERKAIVVAKTETKQVKKHKSNKRRRSRKKVMLIKRRAHLVREFCTDCHGLIADDEKKRECWVCCAYNDAEQGEVKYFCREKGIIFCNSYLPKSSKTCMSVFRKLYPNQVWGIKLRKCSCEE